LSLSLSLLHCALSIVHAQSQSPIVVSSLSQLTAAVLNPSTDYRMTDTLSVSGAVTIAGAANSTITCVVLPCFTINATNADVRFTNVILRFTPPTAPSQVFSVVNVGHLVLSDLQFQSDESERTRLVQWTGATRGNLTIRGLGSAAAPVGFQSLVVSSAQALVDAFVFEDSHGSCANASTCIALKAAPSAAPTSTIAFNNVHWRQNGTATELILPSGSFASLSLTRSTTFDQMRVDISATILNITIKRCTMYGGIRAKGMSLMHVSDVRFFLETFFKKANLTSVIDTYNTNVTTFVMENVVATSKLELGLHLLGLFNDSDSSVVIRNVTVVGLRALLFCNQNAASSGLLRQLTVESVQMRGCVFTTFVSPLGVRNSSIANVSVVDNVGDAGDSQYLLRANSFEEFRVSNVTVVGGSFFGAVSFEGGSPNAILSIHDVQISNATMTYGVVARQASDAETQRYEITNFGVQDSTADGNLIVTNASTSLTGLTLLNVTTGGAAIYGDFPVINGVTVRGTLVSLVDSRPAQNAVWTNFDVQATEFQQYFAIVRPLNARINLTFSDWSVQDLVALGLPSYLLLVQNDVGEAVIDRFFVSPFAGTLWNDISSQKFTLRNSVFDRTGFLIREHRSAADVVVMQNVTMTNGNCASGQPALQFFNATSVSVSVFRVTGGTCMALDADRSNVTVVDSQFERINATAVSVANSNVTISGSVFRGMRGTALVSQRSPVIVLQNTLFEDNVAARGSAIRSFNLETMQIVGSRFFNNSAGGAIVAHTLRVSQSLFRGNSAGDDGAAIFGDDIQISECDFEGNVGRSVIYLRAPKSPALIAASSFFGNTIQSANDTGGVVLLANGTFEVRVAQSCLCNNTRASFDCDALAVSLAVDNTTETEGASLRCPLTQFQALNCTTAGCKRRVPGLTVAATTTTTTTTATATTTASTTTAATTTASTAPTTTAPTTTVSTTTAPTTAGSTNNSTLSTAARVPETSPAAGLDGGTLGAIIGGCIAGILIIGGIVAFVVIRKRKQSPSAASADAANPKSEYGPIALKEYDDPSSVRAPHTSDSNYHSSALTNLS
jgi:predicted outer membrane repeat protein